MIDASIHDDHFQTKIFAGNSVDNFSFIRISKQFSRAEVKIKKNCTDVKNKYNR